MIKPLVEFLNSIVTPFLEKLPRENGFLLRALLCWGLGLLVLASDESSNYDTRFNLRGNQKASDQIVLVTIKESEVASAYLHRNLQYSQFDINTDITDSFYWNEKIWSILLNKILNQNPKSIGITLYFGNNIEEGITSPADEKIFLDKRVIWSSASNYFEQDVEPRFVNFDGSNVGSNDISRDDDGLVRRHFPDESAHLSERLAGQRWPHSLSGIILNYRGDSTVFKKVSLSEVMFDEVPPTFFENKIVLIGAESDNGQFYMTPLGPQSRLNLLAHVTDNLLNKRTIKRFHFAWYALLLLALTILAIYLITKHPQKVAVMFLIWLMTLTAALSVWSFDAFYIWMPTISSAFLMLATWIIFIGYQATKIEKMHFQLQQEQKSLQELEQLKNNFVSLISHDLKTPIAKIQAAVDRMMVENQDEQKLTSDLKNLRSYSEELNRYIQSVLQLLRLESKDFHINKEVGDINEIIESVIEQVRPLASGKNIKIHTDLEPLFSFDFDLTLIKEVVLNIIENAIKYTPTGGTISITSNEIDNFVIVKIKDTGEGIKPEDLDKIWGKFTRGSDQDLKTKGTGLGLYLVKYFIELHRGTVSLISEFGEGTEVVFSLPIEDVSETEEKI